MPPTLKHESSRAIATQVWIIIPFPREWAGTEAREQDKVPASQARLLPATRCKFILHLFSFSLPLSCLLFPFPFSLHLSQFLNLTYALSFSLNTNTLRFVFKMQRSAPGSWKTELPVWFLLFFFLSRSFKCK